MDLGIKAKITQSTTSLSTISYRKRASQDRSQEMANKYGKRYDEIVQNWIEVKNPMVDCGVTISTFGNNN